MIITKENLLNIKKDNEVVVDFNYLQRGTDGNNFPTYEIEYTLPPKNYSLVRLLEPLKVAILKDLDYVKPTI